MGDIQGVDYKEMNQASHDQCDNDRILEHTELEMKEIILSRSNLKTDYYQNFCVLSLTRK